MGDLVLRGVLAFSVLAACSADSSTTTLVATTTEPSGANCSAGGVAIHTGLDDNGNGILDPSEIDATSFVCQPAGAPAQLVRIDDEPAGTNCTEGGSAIHAGADTNGNGALDDAEITSTTYVCNGPPGQVPAGPTVIEGTFVVHNSIDAAQLVGIKRITGDLYIEATGLTAIDLSSLQTVVGTLWVNNFSGSAIALPALQSAGALRVNTPLSITAPALTDCDEVHIDGAGTSNLHSLSTASSIVVFDGEFDLGGLTTAGYVGVARAVIHADSLTTVDAMEVNGTTSSLHLPALVHATQLFLNDTTSTFDAPLLADVQDLSFSPGGSAALSLPLVTTLGSLYIRGGAPSLALPNLVTAAAMTFDQTTLTTINFPSLTSITDELSISGNASLTSFTAPLGPPMTLLEIVNNPSFPQCRALALATATQATNQSISNNDLSATCP